MTDNVPAKKRRRRKRRPSTAQAGGGIDVQQIVNAAVNAALAGRVMPPVISDDNSPPSNIGPGVAPYTGDAYDDEAEARAIAAQRRQEIAEMSGIDALAKQIIPHIVKPHQLDVWNWMRGGSSDAALLMSVVRAAVARQVPEYRESKGAGGASSRDLSHLENKL